MAPMAIECLDFFDFRKLFGSTGAENNGEEGVADFCLGSKAGKCNERNEGGFGVVSSFWLLTEPKWGVFN